jgi:hypothetical protein
VTIDGLSEETAVAASGYFALSFATGTLPVGRVDLRARDYSWRVAGVPRVA